MKCAQGFPKVICLNAISCQNHSQCEHVHGPLQPSSQKHSLPHGVQVHSGVKQSGLSGTLSLCLSTKNILKPTKSTIHD